MKKKLKARPSLEKLSPLKSVEPTDWDDTSIGNWSSENQALMDARTLKSLFFGEDWVYITVDAYAQPLSTVPLRVFARENTVANTDAWKPVSERHKLNQMLKRPNDYQDETQFLYSVIADYILGGNAFFFFAPKSGTMIPVGFERVSYQFENGLPKSFMVTTGVDETFTDNKPTTYKMDEICHVKRPNPASVFYGLSPFVPARKSLLFNRYSQEYLNSFYLKGATPQFILSLEREANELSAQRLLKSMEQAYTGRRNQRRTMLLPKGVSITTAENKISDQQLVDLINLNRETILNTLHIPKHVVGLQAAGSLGSEESKMALRYFWESAVRPTGDSIASAMTKYFRDQRFLGENEELRFDYSGVMALQENLDAKANLSIQMLQSHTLNEVRAALWQLPPVKGGDALPGSKPPALQAIQVGPDVIASQPETPNISPAVTEAKALLEVPEQNQKAPYDVIDFQPTQQMANNAERGLKLREEYGRGGTMVGVARAVQLKNRENLSPETVRRMKSFFARHQHDNLTQVDPPSNGYIAHLLWGGDEGRSWAERIVARMDRIDEMEDNEESIKALSQDMEEAAKKPEPEMVLWSLDLFTDAAKISVGAANTVYRSKGEDEDKLKEIIEEELKKLEADYLERYMKTLEPALEDGYRVQAATVFDAPARESLLAAMAIDRENRMEFLRARGIESFEGINKTTTDEVMKSVLEAVKQGKSTPEIIDDIRGYFSEKAAMRARRIARTETLTAISMGQASMMRTAAKAVPELKKIWVTMADERVRGRDPKDSADHYSLHGVEKNWNESFVESLSYPRDPKAPAEQVVNCRCTMITIFPQDIEKVREDIANLIKE